MKSLILIFSFLAVRAEANFLDGKIYRAGNCFSCEVKFREQQGKIVADMINWGKVDRLYAVAVPVEIENESSVITLKVRSENCTYTFNEQTDLVFTKYQNEHDFCPYNLKFVRSFKALKEFTLEGDWESGENEGSDINFITNNKQTFVRIMGKKYPAIIDVDTYSVRLQMKDSNCDYYIQGRFNLVGFPVNPVSCPQSIKRKL